MQFQDAVQKLKAHGAELRGMGVHSVNKYYRPYIEPDAVPVF